MKFELVLQGDKKIILTKEEADILSKGLLNKQELFKINENVFKRSAVKGMFPVSEEVTDNREQWAAENRAWSEFCYLMSKRSVEEKTDTEMTNRIFPGLMLNKLSLPDEIIAVMEANIKMFFEANKLYPRCPMRVWWPFIADIVAPEHIVRNDKGEVISKKRPNPNLFMAKWWDYVSRNDEAIALWIRYQK